MRATRYILAFASAAALSTAALAQGLTPTVSVTRDYEGKLLEVDKPSLKMDVPDSLYRFKLDFDYSVSSRPYSGSYEFHPYLQDIRPEARTGKTNCFWLRAGAGYTLNPEFELIWAPRFRSAFRMDIYAFHGSYFGKYRPVIASDGILSPEKGSKDRFKGFDSYTRAGLQGGYDWDRGMMDFDVNYQGIAAKDSIALRNWNSLNVFARVRSNCDDAVYFYYDASIRYRYGRQGITPVGTAVPAVGMVQEHNFAVKATLGPVLSHWHGILVDIDAGVVTYGKTLGSHSGRMGITPEYVYRHGRWNIEAGVKVEGFLRPEGASALGTSFNQNKSQIVYPKVNVHFTAVEDYLDIYARVGGGGDIHPYSEVLEGNHWFTPDFAAGGGALLDNSIERVSAALGFAGNIASRFSYDISGGYANFSNGLVDRVVTDGTRLLPGFGYADYHYAFARLACSFNSENVEFHGSVNYRYTNLIERDSRKGLPVCFEPARLAGDFSLTYNWKKRIYAGVSIDGEIARRGRVLDISDSDPATNLTSAKIPGFADLGVNLEYWATKKLSVWAKGGNLLNMNIQRCPLYCENGINFTLGICLKLQ